MVLVALLALCVAAMSVLLCFKLYYRVTTGMCICTERMDGKTVIVTGANCGIGKETARDLAARGARVILACRDLQKADQARDDIVATTGSRDVLIRQLDVSSLESVRAFAAGILKTETRLDVLVNNAGANGLPHAKTDDGLDITMAVNHFGPFLLTCLLLDLLRRTGSSRIIMVSSSMHVFYNDDFDVEDLNVETKSELLQAYSYSKLCNILVAQYLAEKLSGTGVVANSLHPGIVRTEVLRNIPVNIVRRICEWGLSLLFKTAVQGAQTQIHLAVSREGGEISGKYFADCKVCTAPPGWLGIPSCTAGVAALEVYSFVTTKTGRLTREPGLAERVWTKSEELVGLQEHERPFR